MNLGFHLRAWLIALLSSAMLLLVVALPPLYSKTTRDRTIFVAVMIPCMSVLYGIVIYVVLYRPLVRCGAAFRQPVPVTTGNGGPTTPAVRTYTKELYKLSLAMDGVTSWMQRFRELVHVTKQTDDDVETPTTTTSRQQELLPFGEVDTEVDGRRRRQRVVSTDAIPMHRHEPYDTLRSQGSGELIEGKVFYSLPPTPTD